MSSPGKSYLLSSSRTSSSTRSSSSGSSTASHLVEEDDDVRDLDLAGQQDVLAGLGHRPVGRGDDQDRAVHLGGAGDHVLDVVGVAGAVDVGVVAGVGLVLDVGDGDGDPALALLGRVVDRVEGAVLRLALQSEVLGDRRGQARLAVVDVTDRADVDVRLRPLELLLRHVSAYSRLSMLLAAAAPPRVVGPLAGRRVVIEPIATAMMEPTIGLEPMTSSLPRKCSAS